MIPRAKFGRVVIHKLSKLVSVTPHSSEVAIGQRKVFDTSIHKRLDWHVCILQNSRRYTTNRSPTQHEDQSQTIVTVDKWGIQRECRDDQKPRSVSSNGSSSLEPLESDSEFIFELSRLNFHDLLQGEYPVIIEAYLPDSESSRRLGEKLRSKLVQYKGSIKLARLNASIEHELVASLKLTQIPTVIGVFNGRTINSFVGLPDDNVLDQFIEMVLRAGGHSQLQDILATANHALEVDRVEEARKIFSGLLNQPSMKSEAIALSGLSRCALKEGHLEEAQEFLNVIASNFSRDLNLPEVLQATSALQLVSNVSNRSIEELKRNLRDKTEDLGLRHELATKLWAASQQQAAIDVMLELVKMDKHWNEQAGRKFLVKVFETLGPEHPLTISNRRRFGNIWFS